MGRRLVALAVGALLARAPSARSGSALTTSASPYLEERSADRVAWMAWGDEAFARAGVEGKAVLLLIGRAGCAACLAREARGFRDAHVAEVLAASLVPVAVDVDDRPDLADLYSLAAGRRASDADSLLVLLLPDGRPFLTETRALSEDDPRPALVALALRVAGRLRNERGEVERAAAEALSAMRRAQTSEPARGPLSHAVVAAAVQAARETLEGPAPSASLPALRFLLEEHARSGDGEALRLARRGLDAALGATPDRERSRAEEALLIRACAQACSVMSDERYREAARTRAAALRPGRDPSGRIASSADDDRLFTAANGLVIGALAVSGAALSEPDQVAAARALAAATLDSLGPPAALRRSVRARSAVPRSDALLDDHAYLADGLLDLYDATGEERWLSAAEAIVSAALERFLDVSSGGFFLTPGAIAPLGVRPRSGYDDILPSPNGIMAGVLLRLAEATGQTRYRDAARRAVEGFAGDLQRAPGGMLTLASAAAALWPRPVEAEAGPGSARVSRAEVALELVLFPPRARPGETVQASVRVRPSAGGTVVARSAGGGLVPLAVTGAGAGVAVGAAHYPDAAGANAFYTEEAVVTIPVTVEATAKAGESRLRFRVRFQACRGSACSPPDSVVLEAPVLVTPP